MLKNFLVSFKNKKWISVGLTVTALAVFVIYILTNLERFSSLFQISALSIALLLFLVISTWVGNSTVNYFLYQGLQVRISLRNSLGLAAINTLANQLPFSGGLIAKGVYLKKRYGLSYTRYVSATGALYVCFLATNGLVGIFDLGLLSLLQGQQIPAVLVVGFSLMMGSLILLLVPIRIPFIPQKWQGFLQKMEEGWFVLREDKDLLIKMVGIQTVSILVMAGRYWIAFHAFSQQVTFLECVLFSAATILTQIVSISPGGLGVREGIVAGLGTLMGFDLGVSAVAVGFDRLVSTTVVLILGIYFTYNLGQDAFTEV